MADSNNYIFSEPSVYDAVRGAPDAKTLRIQELETENEALKAEVRAKEAHIEALLDLQRRNATELDRIHVAGRDLFTQVRGLMESNWAKPSGASVK